MPNNTNPPIQVTGWSKLLRRNALASAVVGRDLCGPVILMYRAQWRRLNTSAEARS